MNATDYDREPWRQVEEFPDYRINVETREVVRLRRDNGKLQKVLKPGASKISLRMPDGKQRLVVRLRLAYAATMGARYYDIPPFFSIREDRDGLRAENRLVDMGRGRQEQLRRRRRNILPLIEGGIAWLEKLRKAHVTGDWTEVELLLEEERGPAIAYVMHRHNWPRHSAEVLVDLAMGLVSERIRAGAYVTDLRAFLQNRIRELRSKHARMWNDARGWARETNQRI